MNLEQARQLAIDLMAEHMPHLKDWVFAYDNAQVRAGSCNYRKKLITLSPSLTLVRDYTNVKNTILHEIAHALAPRNGHGKTWKRIAKQIGCTGETCYSDVKVEWKYQAICPNGHVHFRFKRTSKRQSCGICSSRFNEKYLLIYKPV